MTAMRWAFVLLGLMGCRTDSNPAEEKPAAEAEPEPTAPTPSPADTPTPPSAPWSRGLQAALAAGIVPPQTDDGTYRVDPFVAALVFEELQALGEGSTVKKFTSDGKDGTPAAGYRLEGIVEDSLFHRLGLRDGDVIEALNGVVLTGPDRIGFALDGAENAVSLTIFRDQMSFTNSYRLSGGLAWRNLLAEFTGAPDPGAGVDATAAAGEPEAERGAGAEAEPSPDATPEPEVAPDAAPDPEPAAGGREPRPTPRPKPGTSKLPPSPKPAPRPSKPAKTGVTCDGASRCSIEKDVFDDMVTSPQRLTREAKVVPAIRNDVHSGYKLSWIKPGGSVAALGFRSGDKITHVNGKDLTDDMQAMALYMSLSSTRVFKVRYERGTQKLVKTITVV